MTSKIALLVLAVAFTTIKGNSNFACTRVYGGYCSHTKVCSDLGGNVEKLPVNCGCGACCKCTDACADGSTCISEGETCNGTRDTSGCCGNRVCCTPISTTPITTPITTPDTTSGTTPPETTPACDPSGTGCLQNHSNTYCGSSCAYEIPTEDCCGQKCCSEFPV